MSEDSLDTQPHSDEAAAVLPEAAAQQSPQPELAAKIEAVFHSNADKAQQYHQWLAEQATLRGLIGPRETPKLWERHIFNSAVLAGVMPEHASVADIGSGAGLPGIPLALARPDLKVYLIEPLLRRTTFLEEVVEALQLDNVTVVRGRAEDATVKQTVGMVDITTSRAVAPLGKLARWSLPLTKSGGSMIALKGSSAEEEIQRDQKDIAKAKGTNARVLLLGENILEVATYAVFVDKR